MAASQGGLVAPVQISPYLRVVQRDGYAIEPFEIEFGADHLDEAVRPVHHLLRVLFGGEAFQAKVQHFWTGRPRGQLLDICSGGALSSSPPVRCFV
jgi:hypothetical protein